MAIINLAGLYNTRLGQPEEARALYTRALELDISENERRSILNVLRNLT
jgi:predicted RNA polymerase sigma factor